MVLFLKKNQFIPGIIIPGKVLYTGPISPEACIELSRDIYQPIRRMCGVVT